MIEKDTMNGAPITTVFQTPWREEERLGKKYLSAYRVQFYEEEISDVEKWRNEDGWYVGYFMVDDQGTKEIDGSNEVWEPAGGGVHWPSEEERATGWIHYCYPDGKDMIEYVKVMFE